MGAKMTNNPPWVQKSNFLAKKSQITFRFSSRKYMSGSTTSITVKNRPKVSLNSGTTYIDHWIQFKSINIDSRHSSIFLMPTLELPSLTAVWKRVISAMFQSWLNAMHVNSNWRWAKTLLPFGCATRITSFLVCPWKQGWQRTIVSSVRRLLFDIYVILTCQWGWIYNYLWVGFNLWHKSYLSITAQSTSIFMWCMSLQKMEEPFLKLMEDWIPLIQSFNDDRSKPLLWTAKNWWV